MEQIQLSEEALLYKKGLGDMNDMSSTIQSKCKFTACLILVSNLYALNFFLANSHSFVL